jgi:hypothetical protein
MRGRVVRAFARPGFMPLRRVLDSGCWAAWSRAMRPASAQKASPAAVKYAFSAAARTRSTAGLRPGSSAKVQGLVADAVLAALGGRGVQVAGHRVAGLQPGGDVAAGAAEGAPGGVPAVCGPDGRRAAEGALAAAAAGEAGKLAGQGQRLGEQGGDGGVSKVRASQEISGGSSGWPPRAGLTVMPEPWSVLPRGSPPGGAGSATVTVIWPPSQNRPMASGTVRSSP